MSDELIGAPDWQGWIGRTTTATQVLDPGQANHMAVTLDREPTFAAGDALPPAWHWLYFHDLVKASDLGSEGHPRLGIVMPPVPLPRRMWAAGRLEFHSPLALGSLVERASIVRSITPKEGRSGPLYFVTVEHTLRTGGTLNLVEEQSIVYRELSDAALPQAALVAPAAAQFSRRHALDGPALFRYSALTFNGHRIHYDVDYSRSVEGYPNLVIHGPLVATLLLDLALEQGFPLARFTYRARSPLFLPDAFSVNGRLDGRSLELWAANASGGLAMEARAEAM